MITAAELEQYSRYGYCLLSTRLPPEDLATLSTTADALLSEPIERDDRGRLHNIGRGADRQFLSLRHEEFPELSAFVLGRQLEALASALLKAPPLLFVEQFVVKGPGTGAAFGWHQDSGYVGFEHPPYLTFWIAIDPATEENGCITVLPRSPDQRTVVEPHEWDDRNKERVGYRGQDPGQPVPCPAGSIIAFASTTLHRSGPNTTDRARRAYVCQYSSEPIIDPTTGRPKHFAKPLRSEPNRKPD